MALCPPPTTSAEAEQELCYYNGKGCWLGGRVGAYCPVMAPDQNGREWMPPATLP